MCAGSRPSSKFSGPKAVHCPAIVELMLLGAHVSCRGGPQASLDEGERLEAECVQLFLGSPRTWRLKISSREDGHALKERLASSACVQKMVVHASYLINLASLDDSLYAKSNELISNTLLSASNLQIPYVVLHVGSHRNSGYGAVRDRIVESLGQLMAQLSDHPTPTKLLLENAAGAGGTIGGALEELEDLIQGVEHPSQLGVCIDTQHLFAYGYDLRKTEVLRSVHTELSERFGQIDCVHLNDSKTAAGEKHDRHANLGEGEIGLEILGAFLTGKALETSLVILEVPGEGEGPRPQDIKQLRSLAGMLA